jgi:hypothetical protein
MRKFIALGVGAIATATMAFSTVSPASATISPPGSVVGQVCASLPTSAISAASALASATLAQGVAVTDLATKTTSFGVAQGDMITALVSYLHLVDSGGSVGAAGQLLSDKVSDYSAKGAAWGNASTAVDAANHAVALAGLNQGAFAALLAGLGGCV